ncbi:MAG: YbhB/YbcL family Raf kinase inhibitor-like protein [Rhodothermales bacterium]
MAHTFTVRTGAFDSGTALPDKYTCEGENVSPPFTLDHVPDAAKTLAIIVDDPDAPRKTFVHWVLFNVPASATDLPENLDIEADLPPGDALEGVNDFGDMGYGGPCPPPGADHHYQFRFYALDTPLDVAQGATKKQVTQAMDGHVLAEAEVVGTYRR